MSNKKQKLRKQTYKKTHKFKTKGGKVLASGGYGCVFSPALKCSSYSSRDDPYNKDHISKLMTVKHANAEYNELKKIKNKLNSIPNYDKYFLLEEIRKCKPAILKQTDLELFKTKCTALPKVGITKENINKNLNDLLMLNMPNRGLPIDDYIASQFPSRTYEDLFNLNNSLGDFMENAILPMNEQNVYHNDIKDSNVLVNDTGDLTLIDWGLSVEYIPTDDVNNQSKFSRPFQFNIPFTSIIFSKKFLKSFTEFWNSFEDIPEVETVKVFVNDYINNLIKEKKASHYGYISNVMVAVYGRDHFVGITEEKKTKYIKDILSKEIVSSYIANVVTQFASGKHDINFINYLNTVYIKNVDIWGFIMTYYPLLNMLVSNYETLGQNEITLLESLEDLFKTYLFGKSISTIFSTKSINIVDLKKDINNISILIQNIINTGTDGTSSSGSNVSLPSSSKSTTNSTLIPTTLTNVTNVIKINGGKTKKHNRLCKKRSYHKKRSNEK